MANSDFDPNEHPIRANRGIVIVVVTLGALIILGVGLLIYGVSTQTSKQADTPSETVEAAPIAAPVAAPAAAPVVVQGAAPAPTGSTAVLTMTAGDDRLYVHLRKGTGEEVIRAFDANGAMVYEIPVAD